MSIDEPIQEIDFEVGDLDTYDELFKLVIIGDYNVGKSSLIKSIKRKKFEESNEETVGFDYDSLCVKVNNKILKFQIWDSSGKEQYRNLVTNVLHNSSLVILVYDITNKESFENIDLWLNEVEKNSQVENAILIGTKSDLKKEREVSTEDGKNKSDSKDIFKSFFECSAKSGYNVKELFIEITKLLLGQKKSNLGYLRSSYSHEIFYTNKDDSKNKSYKKFCNCC